MKDPAEILSKLEKRFPLGSFGIDFDTRSNINLLGERVRYTVYWLFLDGQKIQSFASWEGLERYVDGLVSNDIGKQLIAVMEDDECL